MNGRLGFLLGAGMLAAAVTQSSQALTLESSLQRVNLLELYTSHGCSSCPPPIPGCGDWRDIRSCGGGVKLQFAPLPQSAGTELEAHLALLGFGLSSRIGGGENSGRTLEESFVVLSHHQTGPQPNEWRFAWPEIDTGDAQRLAIVAWISRPGGARQVQAVGGWLP